MASSSNTDSEKDCEVKVSGEATETAEGGAVAEEGFDSESDSDEEEEEEEEEGALSEDEEFKQKKEKVGEGGNRKIGGEVILFRLTCSSNYNVCEDYCFTSNS